MERRPPILRPRLRSTDCVGVHLRLIGGKVLSKPSVPGHCEARVIQPNCWKLARNSLLTQKPPYGQGPLFFGVGDLVQLQDGFGRFVTRGTITGVVGFSEHFVVFEVDGRTQAYGITDVPQPNLYTNQFAVPRERAREVARWTATKWLVDTARVLLKKKGMLWMGDILDRMNRMEDDVPLQLPTV